MNENNKNVSVTDVLKFKTENDFGIETELEVQVKLFNLRKDYKAIVKIGKVENEYVFRKKDINKLSTSTNSTLFKGLSGLDTNCIVKCIQNLEPKLNDAIKEEEIKVIEDDKKKYNDIIARGKEFHDYCKENKISPSSYVMAASRWEVAGEEVNIIRLLLANLSTMRGEPVNLISLATPGTGKSKVEDIAFSMIHDHNYTIINFSTIAAFRNSCINNPYQFEKKIVRLGDLGEEKAEEVMAEVISVIKILNSERYYNSAKMAPDGETVIPIELFGPTAMCFSKVPNSKNLDPQDVSRGFVWTPNIHNDILFSKYMKWVDYIDDSDDSYIEGLFGNIRDYVEYLASLDIEIYNPYEGAMNEIFANNESYRRLLIKQDSLLKMLALLDLPNKDIIDGKIFVSASDFELYCKLFAKSLTAMQEFNVTDADIDFLQTLEYYYDKLDESSVHNTFSNILDDNDSDFYSNEFDFNESFFTVNDIVDNLINERSVHNIIGNVDNQRSRRDKIRYALHRLESFIGKFYIPDINWKGGNFNNKPTLYYIKKGCNSKSLEYFIDNETLSIINNKFGKSTIQYIINDIAGSDGFERRKNKLVARIENLNDKSVFECDDVEEPYYLNIEYLDLDEFF